MKRPVFTLLLITLIAVLNFGLSACASLPRLGGLAQLSNQAQTTPEATLFIPKQAPLVASVLISPQQQAKILFAGAGRDRKDPTSFLGTSGISYAKDVQPWVGDEVTFAVTTTDLDRDSSNGNQPGYLLALTIAKPQKSQAFLPLLWQKRAVPSEDLEVETYQGIALTYQDDEFDRERSKIKPRGWFRSLATAQVGDRYMLIANHPKVLRDAINNAQAPDLSLDSSTSYQTAVKTLSQPQWGWVFANLPALGEWSQIAGTKPKTSTDLPNYRFDKLAIALRSQRNGLTADTLLLAAPEQTVEAFSPTLERSPLLNYLPANSGLGVAGADLSTVWPDLKLSLQGYPTLLSLLEQPQLAFAQQTKAPLFDQVVHWVHGSYALGMLPTATPAQPDWVFMAERSPELESAITTLNNLAKQQGYTTVNTSIEDHPVSTWTQLKTDTSSQQPETQMGAAHTTLGDYELFATSVAALKAAIAASQGDSLADSLLYQKAIAPLPTPNAGSVYVQWSVIAPVLEKGVPLLKWLTWGAPNVFQDLKTATISSLPSQAGTRHNLVSVQVN